MAQQHFLKLVIHLSENLICKLQKCWSKKKGEKKKNPSHKTSNTRTLTTHLCFQKIQFL